jgi:hypothetical protein
MPVGDCTADAPGSLLVEKQDGKHQLCAPGAGRTLITPACTLATRVWCGCGWPDVLLLGRHTSAYFTFQLHPPYVLADVLPAEAHAKGQSFFCSGYNASPISQAGGGCWLCCSIKRVGCSMVQCRPLGAASFLSAVTVAGTFLRAVQPIVQGLVAPQRLVDLLVTSSAAD